jgi:hypothetical protein
MVMHDWFFTVVSGKIRSLLTHHGDVVELVDTLALGASAARREGSSPFIPTSVAAITGVSNGLHLIFYFE